MNLKSTEYNTWLVNASINELTVIYSLGLEAIYLYIHKKDFTVEELLGISFKDFEKLILRIKDQYDKTDSFEASDVELKACSSAIQFMVDYFPQICDTLCGSTTEESIKVANALLRN